MFKTKKGFTLIELLAVIVILGLLALIVTPGIAKVIRNSKMNTAKASLEGYVRELENASTLYLTDTGEYPYSINQLELDGKNISKIENPIVEFGYGEIEKVVVEIDGIYCKYEKGIDTICREESFYSYMKNSFDLPALLEKYGISEICYYDYDNNVDFCDKEGENVDVDAFEEEYIGEFFYKFFGLEIPKEKIKSIEFTNIEPEGEGVDISVNNTNDVLLYSTLKDEMYDIKIYSEKEIIFPEDSSSMFESLNNLDELLLDNTNTSMATNMSRMFSLTGYSSEVFTLDLGDKFDTSNVTNMSYMFYRTGNSSSVFTLDLGDKFDTRNVTDMSGMFSETGYSSEVFTLDLGDKFDTSNVTNMSHMFSLTGYSSEVFILDLREKFDTSNVTNMSSMFSRTGYSNPNFTLDLGDKFDTSNVTDMSAMFFRTGYSNPNLTLDLSRFNTSNVTNMSSMFRETGYSNPNLTLDLSTFDTSNVANMSDMFRGLSNVKTIYVSDKWTTNAVTYSSDMFKNCTSLPNFNSSVVDKTNAHYGTGGYLTLKSN